MKNFNQILISKFDIFLLYLTENLILSDFRIIVLINWNNLKKNFQEKHNIQNIANNIQENKSEQKNLINNFDNMLNSFASDRSLDSCLDALNTSIQLSNVRGKLLQSYEAYVKILENELMRCTFLLEKYERMNK